MKSKLAILIVTVIALSVHPRISVSQDNSDTKKPLVGAWELTADWGKGEGGKKNKYLVIVDDDLTGTVHDAEEGWTTKLRNVKSSDDIVSFSFRHGDDAEFEIEFDGKISNKKIQGTFTVFGYSGDVVGVPISAEDAKSATRRRSVFDVYEARSFTSSEGDTIKYRLYVPEGYDSGNEYPLVLFHHGGGGAGDDNRKNLEGACLREWILEDAQKKNPCFIVAPQIPGKETFRSAGSGDESPIDRMKKHIRSIHEILDSLEKEFSVDKNREYVTGLSFGGECTWLSILARPERFAAAVPICAGDSLMDLTDKERGERFAELPLWIFHGDADKVISVDISRSIVKALREAGGSPKYTEYPGVDHYSWDKAYRDPKLIEWLFQQSRK